MRNRHCSTLAFALLALGQLSCAAGNLTPLPESMPAARAGLQPEYRIFYDALQDYGDWVLIEPFGYVFRPAFNVAGWRPYQDGFWAPSDVYGWVWISAEPFGWATYHYGEWLYDRYQSWVWIPGLDWGPAWVSWEQTPDYVGWAPLSPPGYSASVPGGSYLYVPAGQLAATDLRTHVHTAAGLGSELGTPEPVENMEERDGVTFNRGPSIELVEKLAGHLPRVKIEDLLPGEVPGSKPASEPARAPRKQPEVRKPAAAPAGAPRPSAGIEAMRRAAEEAAREARALAESKAAPPPSVHMLRPVRKHAAKPQEGKLRETPREKAAAADSTR